MEGQKGVFLTARWIHLAMLNYEVDPHLLAPYLPAGTELDDYRGGHYVSIVGFQFLDTRLLGLRVPGYQDFEEVNLRFYVRRYGPEGQRRGVVFIKEIVPQRMTAWLARRCYNENYVRRPMRREDELGENGSGIVRYEWRQAGRWNRLGLRVGGRAYLPEADTEESFISEHYWGYARQRKGGTLEYRVEHPPWEVWRAVESEFDCDVPATYPEAFAEVLERAPHSAFLAQGSPVLVRRARTLV